MQVRVTQAFKYSPDGNSTVTVEEGVAEGADAEAALRLGFGEPISGAAPEAKAAPAPLNKAIEQAPRNKGK